MSEAAPQAYFDISSYLDGRLANPLFIMVEIGHDSLPVAYQQPVSFIGDRAYIGIEAWLRDPIGVKRERVSELRNADKNKQNIFYLAQDLGGAAVRDYEEGPSWYEGEYNPSSLLPDEVADEILVSNVFGDPHIAFSRDSSLSLLTELGRLVSKNGIIVIRETITPQNVIHLTDDVFEEAGLVLSGLVDPINEDLWKKLELVYKGDPSYFYPVKKLDRYRFLSKISDL